ncbi:lysophospholipase [Alkalibacillus flavidus]|uniref:Lysophospholipase n=1 Tax=Alkalibacillus flavidus TaxID=546021 RepID=A0ABV2KVK1_9BACI
MKVHRSQAGKAVVVIVHGAFEHSGRYEWQVNRWTKAGYHVIIGDLPGQGEVEGKRGHIQSFNQYIRTVESWLEEAYQFNLPVFLLGHSMGGLIAIRTLQEIKHSVMGVILSSPGLGMRTGPPKAVHYISTVLDYIYPSLRVKTNINPTLATRNEDFHESDAADPYFLHQVSVRWFHEFNRAIDKAFDSIRYYPDLPILFLQAGDDHLVDQHAVRHFYDKLAVVDKQFVLWPNLYHEVFNEPEREDVFQEALNFTERLIKAE